MKTRVFFAVLSIAAFSIVLPVIRSVNGSAGNYVLPVSSFIADGNPMPYPQPSVSSPDVLVADGDPMPYPLPSISSPDVLLADGDPMPYPLPSVSSPDVLVADGDPMPYPLPSILIAA